jgi:hypothetical protein
MVINQSTFPQQMMFDMPLVLSNDKKVKIASSILFRPGYATSSIILLARKKEVNSVVAYCELRQDSQGGK